MVGEWQTPGRANWARPTNAHDSLNGQALGIIIERAHAGHVKQMSLLELEVISHEGGKLL